MNKRKVLIISIVAGVLLGLLLKWAQWLTGIRVYTLLLNIDYIPVVNTFTLSEPVEFILHLIVAVAVGFVLAWSMKRYRLSRGRVILMSVAMNTSIAICYFPMTMLSPNTPPITSWEAFLVWLLAHIAYGVFLGIGISMYGFKKTEKSV